MLHTHYIMYIYICIIYIYTYKLQVCTIIVVWWKYIFFNRFVEFQSFHWKRVVSIPP